MMKNQSYDCISERDVKKCLPKGIISKKIAERLLKEFESKDCENEDELKLKNPKVKFLTDFLINNKNKILYCINTNENKTFRVSRDIVDSKFIRHIPEKNLPKPDFSQTIVNFPYLELTEAEDKILLILCQLLAKNSERFDQTSPNYYMGNSEKGIITIDNITMETAALKVTPHEIYKTYLGRNNYGSDNSKHLWKTIISLAKKQFLLTITYLNPSKNKKKNKNFSIIRRFAPLFNLYILNQDLSENEIYRLDNKQNIPEGRACRLLFKFNPMFTHTIRERYISYPENIHLLMANSLSNRRGKKNSQATNLMRDLLLREKQLKRYLIKRDESTLIRDLALEKMLLEGRKKRIQQRIDKALNICKEIYLIEDWKIVYGAKGQVMYMIEINKNFNNL